MAAQGFIRVAEVGSVVVVTLCGEHDVATQPSLGAAVSDYARPGAAMVIDLTPATFIDSTVLHTLVRAAGNADILAVVAPPGEPARRLLEVTGLIANFNVCDSADRALRHVLCSADPRDRETALGLLEVADHLLDVTWKDRGDTAEPLRLARQLSIAVGREPLIQDAKLLIADAEGCTPSEAFERLAELSQSRNEKLAELARRLSQGVPLSGVAARDAQASS